VADTVALPTIDFACQLGSVPYTDDHTDIKAWHKRMSDRPSAGAGNVYWRKWLRVLSPVAAAPKTVKVRKNNNSNKIL
jgi:glutathione S-transferase